MAKDRTGPRGGKTTQTETGMVRKTIWLYEDEAEALRREAFEGRRSESDIVREALRRFLKLSD